MDISDQNEFRKEKRHLKVKMYQLSKLVSESLKYSHWNSEIGPSLWSLEKGEAEEGGHCQVTCCSVHIECLTWAAKYSLTTSGLHNRIKGFDVQLIS